MSFAPPSHQVPPREQLDDLLELAYSSFTLHEHQVEPVEAAEQPPDQFDQQFFVDWEVPERL